MKIGKRWELLRDNVDENWTKGDFDYNKFSFGVEIERLKLSVFDNILLGVGYFSLKFPNYESLAEKYGEELSGKIGKNVLNFGAKEVYINSGLKLSESIDARVSYNLIMKIFDDQKIINDGPAYTSDLRSDMTNMVDTLVGYSINGELMKISLGLDIQCIFNQSIQNHYDSSRTKYIPKYYDFSEFKTGPIVSIGLTSMPLAATLSYMFGSRMYNERLVQDISGVYSNDKINLQTGLVRLGVEYMLNKQIKAQSLISYYSSASNMKYEQVYKYNYNTFNYFIGFSWEY